MENKTQFNVWYFTIAVVAIVLLNSWWQQSQSVEVVPYSELQGYLKDGAISEILVTERHMEGVLRNPTPDGRTRIRTVRVEPDVARDFAQYNVKITGGTEETFLKNILSWILPAAMFIGIWMIVLRYMGARQGLGGGLMNIGKSSAKIFVEGDTQVGFDDVAGVDEAKAELQEVVSFLQDPVHYGRLGAHIPKGVLLVGPPGTGKTLLARAVAGEAGVPFFSVSGSEFVEMFVGVGAARVRDLFAEGRKRAPCIIFIDELDALGRARGAFPGIGGHDEKEQTLNQLLVELDGFDPGKEGMVLLSATNRPEILDPALLRAGRFDRQILVDRPDRIGRVQILNVHLRKITLAEDTDTETIAALTPGFTGADLANLVNEAALLATRRDHSSVAMDDFTEAIERIVAGLEKKNRLLNPFERKIVAHHEMGHALVAMALPGSDPVQKVSIIPRGISALGYTIQRPIEDRFLMTKDELEDKMAVLLGGRAAEMLTFHMASTGATDDLSKATDIARSIVVRYGMDETLGETSYENDPVSMTGVVSAYPERQRLYSEETAREIDCAVRVYVHRALARATAILETNRSALDAGADLLLERETLTAEELPSIRVGEPIQTAEGI